MQLMCDAVTVLGSRHGILFDPIARECGMIRFDTFERLPRFGIRAGILVDGKEHVLPLCSDAKGFAFHDQRISPCSFSLMGIDPTTAIKMKLTVVTPFRPRDATFSTTPVLGIRLQASKLAGQFRWTRREKEIASAVLFFELDYFYAGRSHINTQTPVFVPE